MNAKMFEIRDSATFIPVLAVKLKPVDEVERFLLSRAGYGRSPEQQAEYVQLIRVDGGSGEGHCDPNSWNGRTYPVAHHYIAEHFDELLTGAVIDVQFILGETPAPKVSERLP